MDQQRRPSGAASRAAPATHATELQGAEEVARGTTAFRFAKPRGFAFEAGQHATFRLPPGPGLDGEDREHMFSLASAPWEPELVIATRMRASSAWKRRLRNLDPGAPVEVEGPGGNFTLHGDATRPAVLLAGGIGITPFRSMLRDLRRRGEARDVTLFTANRKPADAPFLDELRGLERDMPGFRHVAAMTDAGLDWEGERGRLDAAMLRRHLVALQGPVFYAAGPPGMVRAMRAMLREARVEPKALRTEEFTGY